MTFYENLYSQFKLMEDAARKAWKLKDPTNYVEDSKVVEVEESGVTFEYSDFCWGMSEHRYFVPSSWIDEGSA